MALLYCNSARSAKVTFAGGSDTARGAAPGLRAAPSVIGGAGSDFAGRALC